MLAYVYFLGFVASLATRLADEEGNSLLDDGNVDRRSGAGAVDGRIGHDGGLGSMMSINPNNSGACRRFEKEVVESECKLLHRYGTLGRRVTRGFAFLEGQPFLGVDFPSDFSASFSFSAGQLRHATRESGRGG